MIISYRNMYTRSADFIRLSLPVFDLVALNLSYVGLILALNIKWSIEYVVFFAVCNLFWLISSFFTALYNDKIPKNENLIPRTAQSLVLYYLLLLIFIFLFQFQFSRLFIILNFVSLSLVLAVTRGVFIGASHFIKGKQCFRKKIIILGYNDVSRNLVAHFKKHNEAVQFEGFFDDDRAKNLNNGFPILGGVSNCLSYAINNKVNEIYSTIAPESNKALYAIANEAEQHFIRFKVVPDFHFFVDRKIQLDFARDIPIISLRTEPLEDIASQIKKRGFDIIFSVLVSVFVLSWLVPLLAVIIKLDSKGPVFFIQPRSGKNNKVFRCFKFRSLRVHKEENPDQVTRNDGRFTRIGKFLRRTNLDELPQFFNVLLGDMSVVGPRPHMIRHTQEYSCAVEKYTNRHFIKPGVTGWAQVNGYRGEIKKEIQLKKRIEFDLWYIENWNIWLDMKIIFLTIYTTFKGDKNAF